MDEIQKTAAFIIFLGAVITAMAAIAKYSIRFWNWTLDKRQDGYDMRELLEIKRDIKKIVKEYEPNGGESMKDTLCRIDSTTQDQKEDIKKIYRILDEKVDRSELTN